MGREKKTYPTEFRERMVALVRSGRTAEELGREFEPTAQTGPHPFPDKGAGRGRDLRVYRGLLQHETPTLFARDAQPGRV